MITIFSAKVPQCKTHCISNGKVETEPSANAKTGTLQTHDINTSTELAQLFKGLTSTQSVISGVFPYSTLNSKNTRTKDNASTNNPWYKLDGDYIINGSELSLPLLATIDPQLNNIRHLTVNSSSNIILDNGTPHNSHKKGIWVQFQSQDHNDIKQYMNIIFTRLIINGYGEFIHSTSDKSWSVYLRTIIDTAVFSPERISFEARPSCHDGITHNTSHQPIEGNIIDPTLLAPLTSFEIMQFNNIKKELRLEVQGEVEKKKEYVKRTYPQHYERLEELLNGGYLTQPLIGNDGKDIPNPALIGNGFDFEQDLRDPLDPDYGESKAKAYYNSETGTMYLHSFAHGSAKYRLLFEADKLTSHPLMEKLLVKDKYSAKDKIAVRKLLEQLAPRMLYDSYSLAVVADELPLSKTLTVSLLKKHGVNKDHEEAMSKAKDMFGQYKMLGTGNAPMLFLDPKDGISSLSATGFSRYLNDPLLDMILTDTAERISGMGMYENDVAGKLNLWQGFNCDILNKVVTEEDIKPFIYLITLMTDHEFHKIHRSKKFDEVCIPSILNGETKYILDWCADLVQNPLRNEDLRTALQIVGINRIGKSQFSTFLASFFHPYNRLIVDDWNKVFTRFNSFMAHTVFLQVEEAAWITGFYQMFKNLTSAPYTNVELKGVNGTFEAPNSLRQVITTNREPKHEAVADVRTTTFKMLPKHQHDKKFYTSLIDWWEQGGKQKVFTFFSQRKFNIHNITSALQNDETVRGKLLTLPLSQKFGLLLIDSKPTSWSAVELHDQFIHLYGEYGLKFYSSPNKLNAEIKEMFTSITGDEGFYKHNNKWHIDSKICKDVFPSRMGTDWKSIKPVLESLDLLENSNEIIEPQINLDKE